MALPAWWLGHLGLLGRSTANGAPSGNGAAPVAPALEWYPVGRLLYWCALIAAGMMVLVIPTFGFDAEAFREILVELTKEATPLLLERIEPVHAKEILRRDRHRDQLGRHRQYSRTLGFQSGGTTYSGTLIT